MCSEVPNKQAGMLQSVLVLSEYSFIRDFRVIEWKVNADSPKEDWNRVDSLIS